MRTMGSRRTVYARDGYKCVKCGSTENLTLDHIVPKSLGGIGKVINLQTLCKNCNEVKSSRIECYVPFKRTKKYVEEFIHD